MFGKNRSFKQNANRKQHQTKSSSKNKKEFFKEFFKTAISDFLKHDNFTQKVKKDFFIFFFTKSKLFNIFKKALQSVVEPSPGHLACQIAG